MSQRFPSRPLAASDPRQDAAMTLATVAAEIVGDCEGPGRTGIRHRIWIHRDGSVTAIDHSGDSNAEQVARALGDSEANFCQHWLALAEPTSAKRKFSGRPHRTLLNWTMAYESFWTPKAQWTALAGILNSATLTPINPRLALEYCQTYVAKAGRLPSAPTEHFANLSTPWARQQGGFRRNSAVSAAELGALLDAGVPVEHASVFALLAIDAAVAHRAIDILRRWGHPADLMVRLCYALPSVEALHVLEEIGAERGRRLPSLLSELQERFAANSTMTNADVSAFLLRG